MARPGLRRHVKFKRALRMLSIPSPHLLGHLEALWEGPYETGDSVLGDSLAVEAAAEWDGEDGVLCEALLNCGGPGRAGFIEEVQGRSGIYQIRNLLRNAPEYVKRRYRREQQRPDKGASNADQPDGSNGQQTTEDGVLYPTSDQLVTDHTLVSDRQNDEFGATTSTQHPRPHPYLIKGRRRKNRSPRAALRQTSKVSDVEPVSCSA